ncbi:MAG: outer membrane beta-barrel protein, partial [Terricaulis sp.]
MTKKLKRTLALAALMTGVGGMASVANATEGWYGRADVGMSIDGQLDGEVADGNTTASFGPDLEDGWLGDVGVGYGFGNGFRIEGELSYRNNQFEAIAVDDPIDDIVNGGTVNTWGLMANLFYDFNRGGRIQPYLGVGAGAARPRVKIDGFSSANDT